MAASLLSPTLPGGGTLGRKKAKNYKLLGDDEDDYTQPETIPASDTVTAPEPEPVVKPTVASSSPDDYPADVWACALQCSDQGAAVLHAYNEVCKLRETYREQLASLSFPQQGKGTWAAEPLWAPNKASLPPLTKTNPAYVGMLSEERTASSMAFTKAPTNRQTISQRMNATRDQRKLGLYGQQEDVWSGIESELAAITQRPVTELAMMRGNEFRQKREMLDMLQRVMPLEDRTGGPDTWNMSLRNAWERVVPLGSLFSGLTVTIRETPPSQAKCNNPHDRAVQHKANDRLIKVGRPLEAEAPPSLGNTSSRSAFDRSMLLGRSLRQRNRDWASSEVLKSRLDKYAEAINRHFSHMPEMHHLAVTGQSLAGLLESSLACDVTLGDVMSHLQSSDSDAAKEVGPLAQQLRTEQQQQAEAAGADAAEQQVDTPEALSGIHLACDQQQLLLQCNLGQQGTGQVTLHNQGTVALSYSWQRTIAPPHPLSHGPRAHPNASSCTAPTLHVLPTQGVILPGESHTSRMVFNPTSAGLFMESWRLQTVPALPAEHSPVEVHIRGAAVQPPSGAPARQQLSEQLDQEEKMAKVNAAVERILHNVCPPAPTPAPETEEQRLAAQSWDTLNGSISPPCYWPGEAVYAQLQDIYCKARAALVRLLKPPETAAASKKAPPPAKGKPAEPEAPITTWAEEWSGSLADMDGLLDELTRIEGAGVTEEQAAEGSTSPASPELKQQLASILASHAVRVPRDGRALMRHTVRAALGKVLDTLDTKLSALRAEYDQKHAATQEHTGKLPASAQPPTAQWLTDKVKAGTKTQLKTLVATWWEEIAREKGAAAEWMGARLQRLDAAHAPAAADEQSDEQQVASSSSILGEHAPADDEEYQWLKFALLRESARLGLPEQHHKPS